MSLLDRISVDPAIRFGKPCIRGTRITVGDVLGYLAGGTSEDRLLEFPQLVRDDIRACLTYAAERERRTIGFPAALSVRLLFDEQLSGEGVTGPSRGDALVAYLESLTPKAAP